MEIIVGLLALQAGLIGQKLFVALVIMALATSLMCGPLVSRVLRLKRPRRLVDYLAPRSFLAPLRAADRFEAIAQLCQAVSAAAKLEARLIEDAVQTREKMMPTGMGKGVAVPHARIDGVAGPVVAIGLSQGGVDFDAPDGRAAQIICLILSPRDDDGAQVSLLADVARMFGKEEVRHQVMQVNSYTDFRAVLNTQL
jgi:mannitol/fructose-specific phosphotransferase system IIA component (Ntr-type)